MDAQIDDAIEQGEALLEADDMTGLSRWLIPCDMDTLHPCVLLARLSMAYCVRSRVPSAYANAYFFTKRQITKSHGSKVATENLRGLEP